MKYDVTSCVIRLLTSVIFLALSSNFDYHTRRHVSIVHPSWTFSKVVEAAGAQLVRHETQTPMWPDVNNHLPSLLSKFNPQQYLHVTMSTYAYASPQ